MTRVRTAAAAWRNGLGVLLAALVGFGLIKGRSDVNTLPPLAAAVVGVLLLLALVAVLRALLLLRASFGEPRVVATRSLPSTAIAAHQEALGFRPGAQGGNRLDPRLRRPARRRRRNHVGRPRQERAEAAVSTGGDPLCGAVKSVGSGILALDTPLGERDVRLATLTGIEPVQSRPGQ